MGSICLVMLRSSASVSFSLSGRTRQKTRIEPLISSMVLCNLFRLTSAVWTSASGTPAAKAARIAQARLSVVVSFPVRPLGRALQRTLRPLAARTESMSFISADWLASNDSRIASKRCLCFCNRASNTSAAAYSAGSKLTDLAFSIMSSKALIVATPGTMRSRRASRACCLGSSSCKMASARCSTASSTPPSLPCWMANFSAATFLDSIASDNFSAALSLDSAPANRS
mmetsp:Transcript_73580/g.225035  ORF Transcript_73580/g.225035 Transcript_73580/m.225035 type:complete len:228 (+) Transcript_73580:736-1419(+)